MSRNIIIILTFRFYEILFLLSICRKNIVCLFLYRSFIHLFIHFSVNCASSRSKFEWATNENSKGQKFVD